MGANKTFESSDRPRMLGDSPELRRLRRAVGKAGGDCDLAICRRITRQLHAEGMIVNHKAVARLMRQNGLQVRPLRKFVRTTDSDHDGPSFPNLARGFRPTGPKLE